MMMINSSMSFIRALGLSHKEILAHKKKYLKEVIVFMSLGVVTFLLSLITVGYNLDIYLKVLSFFIEFAASLFILRIYLKDKNTYLQNNKESLDIFYYIFRYLKSVVVVWGTILFLIVLVLFLSSFIVKLDVGEKAYPSCGLVLLILILPIFNLAPEIVILQDVSIWEGVKKSFNITKNNIILVWFRSIFGMLFYLMPLLYSFMAESSLIGIVFAFLLTLVTLYLDILYNRASVKMVFNLVSPEIKTNLI